MTEDTAVRPSKPDALPSATRETRETDWRKAETAREAARITWNNIKEGIANLRAGGWEGIRAKVEKGAEDVQKFVKETAQYWRRHPGKVLTNSAVLFVMAYGMAGSVGAIDTAQAAPLPTPDTDDTGDGASMADSGQAAAAAGPFDGGEAGGAEADEGKEKGATAGVDAALPAAEQLRDYVTTGDYGGNNLDGDVNSKGYVEVDNDSIRDHSSNWQRLPGTDPNKVNDGAMNTLHQKLADNPDFGLDHIRRGEGMGFDNVSMLMGDSDLHGLPEGQSPFQVDSENIARALVNVENVGDLPGVLTDLFTKDAQRLGQDPSTVDIQGKVNDALAKLGITVNDWSDDGRSMEDFTVGLTSLGEPDGNGVQHEVVRSVRFNSDTDARTATFDNQGTKSSAVVAMVIEDDGESHVQVFSNNATADTLNPEADEPEEPGKMAGVDWARMVPVGEAAEETESTVTEGEIPEGEIPETEIPEGEIPDDEEVVDWIKNNRGKGNNLYKGYDLNNPSLLRGDFGKMTLAEKQAFLWAPDVEEVKPSLSGGPIVDPSSTLQDLGLQASEPFGGAGDTAGSGEDSGPGKSEDAPGQNKPPKEDKGGNP